MVTEVILPVNVLLSVSGYLGLLCASIHYNESAIASKRWIKKTYIAKLGTKYKLVIIGFVDVIACGS